MGAIKLTDLQRRALLHVWKFGGRWDMERVDISRGGTDVQRGCNGAVKKGLMEYCGGYHYNVTPAGRDWIAANETPPPVAQDAVERALHAFRNVPFHTTERDSIAAALTAAGYDELRAERDAMAARLESEPYHMVSTVRCLKCGGDSTVDIYTASTKDEALNDALKKAKDADALRTQLADTQRRLNEKAGQYGRLDCQHDTMKGELAVAKSALATERTRAEVAERRAEIARNTLVVIRDYAGDLAFAKKEAKLALEAMVETTKKAIEGPDSE